MRRLGIGSCRNTGSGAQKTRGYPPCPDGTLRLQGMGPDWYDFSGRKPRLRPTPTPPTREAKEAVRRLGSGPNRI